MNDGRLDIAEENIIKLEDKAIEAIKIKQTKSLNEKSINKLWDIIKQPVYVIKSLKERREIENVIQRNWGWMFSKFDENYKPIAPSF